MRDLRQRATPTCGSLPHPYTLFNNSYMYTNDSDIPVKRLQLDKGSGTLQAAPHKELFLRGPIPIPWLSSAAKLPGKAINLALALCWLSGLAKGKPFKIRADAVRLFNVSRDATDTALVRLEDAGLIQVERRSGQRPIISIRVQGAFERGSDAIHEKQNDGRHTK